MATETKEKKKNVVESRLYSPMYLPGFITCVTMTESRYASEDPTRDIVELKLARTDPTKHSVEIQYAERTPPAWKCTPQPKTLSESESAAWIFKSDLATSSQVFGLVYPLEPVFRPPRFVRVDGLKPTGNAGLGSATAHIDAEGFVRIHLHVSPTLLIGFEEVTFRYPVPRLAQAEPETKKSDGAEAKRVSVDTADKPKLDQDRGLATTSLGQKIALLVANQKSVTDLTKRIEKMEDVQARMSAAQAAQATQLTQAEKAHSVGNDFDAAHFKTELGVIKSDVAALKSATDVLVANMKNDVVALATALRAEFKVQLDKLATEFTTRQSADRHHVENLTTRVEGLKQKVTEVATSLDDIANATSFEHVEKDK